jgi:hypothetical protein
VAAKPNKQMLGFHHRINIGVKSMIFIIFFGFSIEKNDGHDVWLMVDEYMGSSFCPIRGSSGIITKLVAGGHFEGHEN